MHEREQWKCSPKTLRDSQGTHFIYAERLSDHQFYFWYLDLQHVPHVFAESAHSITVNIFSLKLQPNKFRQCGSVGGISHTTIGIRTTLLKISESVSGRKTNLDLGLKRTTPPHHDVSVWLGTIQRDIPAVLLPAWRNMHLHLQLSNCQLSVTLCNSFLCSLTTYLRYWWINLLHVDLCPQRCQCFYNAYLTAQRKAGMSPWLLPSTYPMCHSVS